MDVICVYKRLFCMHVIHCKDDGAREEQCPNRQRIYGNQVRIFLLKILNIQRTTANDAKFMI
jgi:hypothetical protein